MILFCKIIFFQSYYISKNNLETGFNFRKTKEYKGQISTRILSVERKNQIFYVNRQKKCRFAT